MELKLNYNLSENYTNKSQKIRIISESWTVKNMFCANCGSTIKQFPNGLPVADFYCPSCKNEYELKSKSNNIGNKIVDGAYKKMITRIEEENAPNFFFLNYNIKDYSILNFFVIPSHFFTKEIIEKRKPLSMTAKRARWVGCNILFGNIPSSGRIYYIKNSLVTPKKIILDNWKKVLFIKETPDNQKKGWLLDTMNCIDSLNKKTFTLQEVYNFENFLQKKHPNNNHIKDKIRQQLQFLRDKNYITFDKKGIYSLT